MDRFERYALVADDEPLIRIDVQAILTKAGFQVLTAAGAEEALDILLRRSPKIELLFTDVQMPPGKMTGYDLARRCARDMPDIAILVASGAQPPEPDTLPEAALFLDKPFSPDQILRCLSQLLPNR
ncbi:MAG: response regulator [Alphaproteobacteria bacterium]|nr:response regulator [Alphaproteobacteria bacterium]